MNLTIIGASAGIGLETAKLALAHGHRVTTLSRTPPPLPATDHLVVQLGSATQLSDLKTALAGADAVVISIGKKGKTSDASTLFSATGRMLVQALGELTMRDVPVLAVTGFGAGESGRYHGFWMKLLFRLLLKREYDDKTRFEQLLTQGTSRWEIVRPGILTNKPATHRYRALPELQPGMNVGSIARQDVAEFLLGQVEKPTLLRHYVTLTQ